MPLEEDLRHAQANDEARQRVIDKIGPAVKDCLLLSFEMSEEEFREWRDDVKARQRARLRRQKTGQEVFTDTLKWVVTIVLSACGAVFAASIHWPWNPKP
jgi:hypothetical protein